MKTEVLMKRDLDGFMISQNTQNKYFNANELLEHYNAISDKPKLIKDFFSNKGTKAFIISLEYELGINSNKGKSPDSCESSTYIIKKGNKAKGVQNQYWLNPYLFVKFAMWLSTDFEVKVIKWVYDNLIDFRNQSGDHYNEMKEAIQKRYIEHFGKKPNPLVFIKEANYLNKLVYGEFKGGKRNLSNEEQLDKLNKLQLANIKLINQKISYFDRKNKLREFSELLS